jgi:AcrR family transcriptional regulator
MPRGNAAVAEAKDVTRERIMEAARKRFSHYGYAKTTMAELAGDSGMSAGNLYRFFPSKIDIAEAIARDDERARLAAMERIINEPEPRASDRLRKFLFAELRSTYRKFADDPQALEMAQLIARHRPDFGDERVSAERRMIREVLEQGTRDGEFDVSNCGYTAEMVHSAMLKFRFPQRWTHAPLAQLERELDGVFRLIMDGLTSRASHAA